MSRVVTAAHCRERVRKLIDAAELWNEDNSPDIHFNWGGVTIKAFSLELETAFETFIDDTADEGEKVGPDAKLFLLVADPIANAHITFKRGISEDSP